MVAFWAVLFVNVERGIAAAVGYSIVYLLLQMAFARITLVTSTNMDQLYPGPETRLALREDSMVFMLHDAILFPNAARIARRISEQIYTHSPGEAEVQPSAAGSERLWIDSRARLISRLRQGGGGRTSPPMPHSRNFATWFSI